MTEKGCWHPCLSRLRAINVGAHSPKLEGEPSNFCAHLPSLSNLTVVPDFFLQVASAVRSDPVPVESPSVVPSDSQDSLQGLGYFQVKTEDDSYQHNCSNQQSASDSDHNLRPQVEHLSHLAKKFRQHEWLHSQRATWLSPSPNFLQ